MEVRRRREGWIDGGERGREGGREGEEKQKDRKTERDRERHRETETERQRDRETEKQETKNKDRERQIQRRRQNKPVRGSGMEKETDKEQGGRVARQTCKMTSVAKSFSNARIRRCSSSVAVPATAWPLPSFSISSSPLLSPQSGALRLLVRAEIILIGVMSGAFLAGWSAGDFSCFEGTDGCRPGEVGGDALCRRDGLGDRRVRLVCTTVSASTRISSACPSFSSNLEIIPNEECRS